MKLCEHQKATFAVLDSCIRLMEWSYVRGLTLEEVIRHFKNSRKQTINQLQAQEN